MEEKQQFNVYLPADLVRRVKHAAIDHNVSLSEFTQLALEAWLEEGDDDEGVQLGGR